MCAKGSSTQGSGEDKPPPNTALLEGRAEEQGSFGELKVKVVSSGCGEHGECFGDPAGTLSPAGFSPQELGWGRLKRPVVFQSPNRSGKESWGNFNQLPKQTEAQGGNEVPAPPPDPTPPARPPPHGVSWAQHSRAMPGQTPWQQPRRTTIAHLYQFNTRARCGVLTPSAALERSSGLGPSSSP